MAPPSDTSPPEKGLPLLGPIAPIAVAVGLVLHDFAQVGAPLSVAARPLMVTVVLAVASYVVALAATRREAAASAFGASAMLLAWGKDDSAVAGTVLAALAVTALAIGHLRNAWRPLSLGFVAVSFFGVILAATGLGTIALNGGLDHLRPSSKQGLGDGQPMLVLILDGYPGGATLNKWGFENDAFLTGLERRGFDVATRSSSNYLNTQHTLANIVHMRHLDDIAQLANPPDDARERVRTLARVIAEGGLLADVLADADYEFATIPSGVSDVTLWSTTILRAPPITDYEVHLITTTLAGKAAYPWLKTWMEEAYRDTVLSGLGGAADETAAGRFLVVHVMSPHRP